jgi:TIR domain
MKLFVSYHSKDRESALDVADYLSTQGYDTWIDRQLTPGSQYRIDTRQHLEDADLVLVMWTVGAARSAWVNSEAESAGKRGRLVSIQVGDARVPSSFVGTIVGKVGAQLAKRDLPTIERALKRAATSALGVERVYRIGEIIPGRAWDIAATLTTISVASFLFLFLSFRLGSYGIIVTEAGMYLRDGNRLLPITFFVIVGLAIFIATMMAPFASMGARIIDNLGCRLWRLPVTATLSRLIFRWIGESLGSAAPIAAVYWSQDTPIRQTYLEQGIGSSAAYLIGYPLVMAVMSGIFLLSPKFLTLTAFPSLRRALIT